MNSIQSLINAAYDAPDFASSVQIKGHDVALRLVFQEGSRKPAMHFRLDGKRATWAKVYAFATGKIFLAA